MNQKIFKEWDEVTNIVTKDDILEFMRFMYNPSNGLEFLDPATLIDSDYSPEHKAVIYSSDDDESFVSEQGGYHEDLIDEVPGLRAIYYAREGPLGYKRGVVARIGYGVNPYFFESARYPKAENLPSPRDLPTSWKMALHGQNIVVIRGQANTTKEDVSNCIAQLLKDHHIDNNTLVFVNCNLQSDRSIFYAGSAFGPTLGASPVTKSMPKPEGEKSAPSMKRPGGAFTYRTIGDDMNNRSRRFNRILDLVLESFDEPDHSDFDYDRAFHGPDEGEDVVSAEGSAIVHKDSQEVVDLDGNLVCVLRRLPMLYRNYDQIVAEIEACTGKAYVVDHENASDDSIILTPKAMEDLTALESKRKKNKPIG